MRQKPPRFLAILAALALPLLLLAIPVQAQGPSTTGVGSQFELTFWQSVESGNDPALYEAYLAQYPAGTFAAVARVKLAKLRQFASPGAPAPAPVSAPVLAPVPAPIVPAPAPVITTAPAPAQANQQFAAAKAALPPAAVPAARERLAPRDASESAPYVTPAPPTEPATEPAGESADSAALRRLLGVLGDSQRTGAPAPSPILGPVVDAGDASAPDGAQLVPAPVPAARPAASPPRLVETALPATTVAAGPPIAMPDAAALSASPAAATVAHQIAVGPLPPNFALPPRPQLATIPPLAFPASFCSAEARNTFHDGAYIAALEEAKRNNDAAIAYMNQLQAIYDSNQLSGDINPMNAVAAEASAYGPVAAAAFAAQSTLVGAFNTLMAVPILACEAQKQP